jgi:hypothetical protein
MAHIANIDIVAGRQIQITAPIDSHDSNVQYLMDTQSVPPALPF